jgi:hypothetical protein
MSAILTPFLEGEWRPHEMPEVFSIGSAPRDVVDIAAESNADVESIELSAPTSGGTWDWDTGMAPQDAVDKRRVADPSVVEVIEALSPELVSASDEELEASRKLWGSP